jgi:hypothetical protein
MRRLARLGPLVAFGLAVAGCMPPVEQAGGEAVVAVGKAAPLIAGRDANGAPMELSDFRGQVVLLDFWQTH